MKLMKLNKQKSFWIGAILLAIIPLIALDIPKLYIDWKHDVRDERMFITQNTYAYTPQQKASILKEISETGHHFTIAFFLKCSISLLLFGVALYLLWPFLKSDRRGLLKTIALCILLPVITSGLKIYSWTSFSGDNSIRLLPLAPSDTTLKAIYNEHFKGKVVYVDFWGTTCPPCLEEFRNFTRPLKKYYQNNSKIAYLYIASGTRLIWKQQLQKFDLTGSHIFLDKNAYARLYHDAVRGAKDTFVTMPRYVIVDKHGVIVNKDAPSPGEPDSIKTFLNKYLAAP